MGKFNHLPKSNELILITGPHSGRLAIQVSTNQLVSVLNKKVLMRVSEEAVARGDGDLI